MNAILFVILAATVLRAELQDLGLRSFFVAEKTWSHHAPLTPALNTLFLDYAEHHTRCVYDTQSVCRYVLITSSSDHGGLGNRLPCLVTGFMLALLSGRILMMDFESYETILRHPLDFNWHKQAERLTDRHQNVSVVTFEEQPPQSTFYAVTNFKEAYANVSVIRFLMDKDYWIPVLQTNPHHVHFVEEYFSPQRIFQPLAQYLLRFSDAVEDQVSRVKRRHLSGAHTIGIQIRLLKGGVGRFATWTPPPSIESYCAVAKVLKSMLVPKTRVKYFVTSDSPAVYAEVVRLLGPDSVYFGASNFGSHATGAGNPGTEFSAAIDLNLLRQCQDLIITAGSSFGYVAAGMGGISPTHLVYGNHANIQNPYYWRSLSSEPCFWGARDFVAHAPAEVVSGFKGSNSLWIQHVQCH